MMAVRPEVRETGRGPMNSQLPTAPIGATPCLLTNKVAKLESQLESQRKTSALPQEEPQGGVLLSCLGDL